MYNWCWLTWKWHSNYKHDYITILYIIILYLQKTRYRKNLLNFKSDKNKWYGILTYYKPPACEWMDVPKAEAVHHTVTWIRAANSVTSTMGRNWDSTVLICTTRFILYAIRSLICRSEIILKITASLTESVSKTGGLWHCSKPIWSETFYF